MSGWLDEFFPDFGADKIEHRHGDGDQPDGNSSFRVLELANPLDQQEADTATSDQTDDGGHTYVDVPSVNGERDKGR